MNVCFIIKYSTADKRSNLCISHLNKCFILKNLFFKYSAFMIKLHVCSCTAVLTFHRAGPQVSYTSQVGDPDEHEWPSHQQAELHTERMIKPPNLQLQLQLVDKNQETFDQFWGLRQNSTTKGSITKPDHPVWLSPSFASKVSVSATQYPPLTSPSWNQ